MMLSSEQSYKNPDGKCVTFRFRGLRDLNVVHGELEHGTEIIYSRKHGQVTLLKEAGNCMSQVTVGLG